MVYWCSSARCHNRAWDRYARLNKLYFFSLFRACLSVISDAAFAIKSQNLVRNSNLAMLLANELSVAEDSSE